MKTILNYVINHPQCLLHADFLISVFTVTDFRKIIKDDDLYYIEMQPDAYEGIIADLDGDIVICQNAVEKGTRTYVSDFISLGPKTNTSLLDPMEEFELPGGVLPSSPSTIKTTVGRFLVNYALIDNVITDGSIPYINSPKGPKDFNKHYVEFRMAGKIDNDTIKKYITNCFFIQSKSELFVPSFSRKALTSNPDILKRKYELFEIYKDQLHDPIIMTKIEDELIAMDRAYLAGDDSLNYYKDKKTFDIHRKMMYITGGIVESFGSKGNYEFLTNSLEEGLNPRDFPKIANEIRRGIHGRGTETAKGGENTKFVIRVFQNTRIVEDDCRTSRAIEVVMNRDNMNDYLDRSIVISGKLVILTKDNIEQYLDKPVRMRSPMICESKNGFCYTCMGEKFRVLQQEYLTMLFVTISSTFMMVPMKAMHGTKVSTRKITDLNQFVV